MANNIKESHVLFRVKISQKINQRVYVRRGLVIQHLMEEAIKTFNLVDDDSLDYTLIHRDRHHPARLIAKVEELITSDADGVQTPIQLDLERLTNGRPKILREKPPILRLSDRQIELRYAETRIGRTHRDDPNHTTDIDLGEMPGGLTVSRRHALLVEIGNDYQIETIEQPDRAETEIEVNGKLISGAKKLANGDRITLGEITLTFVLPSTTR